MPLVSHSRRSLGQFGFCCGHSQNQFSQILNFSSSFKNLSFAGLGPELSQTKAKFAILEIVQLMSKANVAGCRFFDILKNSMNLMSGARAAPQQKVIGAAWVLLWSWPKPVQSSSEFQQLMQKHIICRPGPRTVTKKAKLSILEIVQLMSRTTVAGC